MHKHTFHLTGSCMTAGASEGKSASVIDSDSSSCPLACLVGYLFFFLLALFLYPPLPQLRVLIFSTLSGETRLPFLCSSVCAHKAACV